MSACSLRTCRPGTSGAAGSSAAAAASAAASVPPAAAQLLSEHGSAVATRSPRQLLQLLPPELLVMIASRLEDANDRASLAATCCSLWSCSATHTSE